MYSEHYAPNESYDAPINALVDDIESSGSVAQYLRDIEQTYLQKDSAPVHQLRRVARAFEPAGEHIAVDTTYPLATRIYWGTLIGMALSEKILASDNWSDTLYKYIHDSYGAAQNASTRYSDHDTRRDLCGGILDKQASVSSADLISEHAGLITDVAQEIASTESEYELIILGFSYIMGHTYRHFEHAEAVAYSASLEAQMAELFD